MKTPREKYQSDNNYRALVNTLHAYIENCHFAPSELREAAILACILYEECHVRPLHIPNLPEDVKKALEGIDYLYKWADKNSNYR